MPDEQKEQDPTQDDPNDPNIEYLDRFDPYIHNLLNLHRDVYTSATVNEMRDKSKKYFKQYFIDGKDVILSDMSSSIERKLFLSHMDLLNILIDMQKKNYYNEEEDEMEEGLMQAIDFIFKKTLNLILSSRAVGKTRDRLLISPYGSSIAGNVKEERDRPGLFNRFMGKGKKQDYEYVDVR